MPKKQDFHEKSADPRSGVLDHLLRGRFTSPYPLRLGTSPPKYGPNPSIRTLLLYWGLNLARVQKSCDARTSEFQHQFCTQLEVGPNLLIYTYIGPTNSHFKRIGPIESFSNSLTKFISNSLQNSFSSDSLHKLVPNFLKNCTQFTKSLNWLQASNLSKSPPNSFTSDSLYKLVPNFLSKCTQFTKSLNWFQASNLLVYWFREYGFTYPTLQMAKRCLKRNLFDDKNVVFWMVLGFRNCGCGGLGLLTLE